MTATRRGKLLHGVALGALLLAGLGLRLYRLGRLSLWSDEGHAVWVAAQPLADYPELARRDTCLPLSYLVTKPFVLVSRSDSAARLQAVLFGVAAIAVVWALGRALGGLRLAWPAALLVTVHPMHLHYSQEARMYAAYVCLIGLAALFLVRFVARPTWTRGALLAGAVAAAAYTHNVAAVWILTLVLAVVPAGLLVRKRHGEPVRKVLLGLGLVGVAVILTLLPWLPVLRQQMTNVGTPGWWMPRPTSSHLTWVWNRFIFTWPSLDAPGRWVFEREAFYRLHWYARQAWYGLLLAGFTAAVLGRRWRLAAVTLWGGLAVVATIAVSQCWSSLIGVRVWLPVVIPLALTQAAALAVPWRAGWGTRCRPLRVLYLLTAAAGLGLVLTLSGFGLWGEYVCERKEDWRGSVVVVAANFREGDVIVTREGHPRNTATWCLEQKGVAWYLEKHGLTGALRREPTVCLRHVDFATGRFEAPPLGRDQPAELYSFLRRDLAEGRRVWTLRRTYGEPETRPPVLDWLDARAEHATTWRRHACAVTLHWGLKPEVFTTETQSRSATSSRPSGAQRRKKIFSPQRSQRAQRGERTEGIRLGMKDGTETKRRNRQDAKNAGRPRTHGRERQRREQAEQRKDKGLRETGGAAGQNWSSSVLCAQILPVLLCVLGASVVPLHARRDVRSGRRRWPGGLSGRAGGFGVA